VAMNQHQSFPESISLSRIMKTCGAG